MYFRKPKIIFGLYKRGDIDLETKLLACRLVMPRRIGVVKLNRGIIATSGAKLAGLPAMFVDGGGLSRLGLFKQSVRFLEATGLASLIRLTSKICRGRILRGEIGKAVLHRKIVSRDFR